MVTEINDSTDITMIRDNRCRIERALMDFVLYLRLNGSNSE